MSDPTEAVARVRAYVKAHDPRHDHLITGHSRPVYLSDLRTILAALSAAQAALADGSFYKEADIDRLMAERDAAQAALAAKEAEVARLRGAPIDDASVAAIEAGGRRWHGEDRRVVSVRWEPYKPDGQRQMKAKGRWQEMVGSGDYWRWQNCERPAALFDARAAIAPEAGNV